MKIWCIILNNLFNLLLSNSRKKERFEKKNEKGLFETQSDRNKNLIQKHIKSERYLRKSSLKT